MVSIAKQRTSEHARKQAIAGSRAYKRISAAWLLIAVLVACQRVPARAPVAPSTSRQWQVYDGVYMAAFERSIFRPCKSAQPNEQWWVTLSGRALTQWDSIRSQYRTNRAYVRWRASVSDTGHFGHLGQSSRYILVDSILEARDSLPHDCMRARGGAR